MWVQIYTYVLYVTHAYILYVCTGPGVQDCLFTWMSSTSLPGAADHASRRRQGQSAEGAAVHRAEGYHPSQCQKMRIGFYHVFTSMTHFRVSFCRMEIHAYCFLISCTYYSYGIQSSTDCFFGGFCDPWLGNHKPNNFRCCSADNPYLNETTPFLGEITFLDVGLEHGWIVWMVTTP